MNNGSSKKTMLFGAFLCTGGIATTAMTYSGTASTAELSYVVAWGAIIFGAIQFVRGVVETEPTKQGSKQE